MGRDMKAQTVRTLLAACVLTLLAQSAPASQGTAAAQETVSLLNLADMSLVCSSIESA